MFADTLTDLLDVRPTGRPPMQGAVNIPLAELSASAGELPPRDSPLWIAETGPEAAEALRQCQAMERKATLESTFELGSNAGPLRLWRPNSYLEEVLPHLLPGKALDLACGVGREAATLAAFGWQVTAVDHLPDALERAERLATRFGLSGRVRWLEADLEQWIPEEADLAAMFFYLDRGLIRRTIQALAPGGSLLLETFTPTHRAQFGKPRHEEFTLSAEEAAALVEGCKVVHLSEGWRESGRHTVRLWARTSTRRRDAVAT